MHTIDLGQRLELLVDSYLIEALRGDLRRQFHQPVARQVVFPEVSDPVIHEQGNGLRAGHAYMTVFQEADRYRMFYGVTRNYYTNRRRWLHYAHSDDGINWQTPSLGLIEYEGSRDNNVVWPADLSPFADANPAAVPQQRYKAIAAMRPGEGTDDDTGRTLFAAASPDACTWKLLQEEPVITDGKFDTQNLAFWDSIRGEYRAYWRDFYPGPGGARYRGIKTATSPDFLSWSPASWLDFPGVGPEELYTNQILPYYRAPHIFVGLPTRYVERPWSPAVEDLPETERRRSIVERTGLERIGAAVTDTVLMTSRDGVTFDLHPEAFLRPGLRPRDNWIYGDNYLNWGIVETASDLPGAPPELTFYASEGSRRDHFSKVFRRYTLRVDGFASLRGGRPGGELLSRPVLFSGDALVLNFSASAAGSLRVELQDRHGVALPGHALADCVELLGDDLARTVRWRAGTDLRALRGTPVRLRVQVEDADLYSLRFS